VSDMWKNVTPGRRKGCPNYSPELSNSSLRQTHFASFRGMLQADAYAGFNELYRNGRIVEATCWAHAAVKPAICTSAHH
jgi:hypothetical protein